MEMKLIDGNQCAGARGMLRMSQEKLAALAGLHPNTVIGFERGGSSNSRSTGLAIRAALESQGVKFTFSDGSRGVELADLAQQGAAP